MTSKKALRILEYLTRVNPAKLQPYFRDREVASDKVVSGPIAIRLDGVNFGKVLKDFRKPRDIRVHEALIGAGMVLMERFNALIAYVASDEINLILKDVPYSGRVFKLVSVSASVASAHTSLSLGMPLYFDSRVVKLEKIREAVTYLVYRSRVCSNNYISQLFHNLTENKQVTPSAREMLTAIIEHRVLDRAGDWEVLGSCMYWGQRIKYGVNPITGEKELVVRRRLTIRDGIAECISYLARLRN